MAKANHLKKWFACKYNVLEREAKISDITARWEETFKIAFISLVLRQYWGLKHRSAPVWDAGSDHGVYLFWGLGNCGRVQNDEYVSMGQAALLELNGVSIPRYFAKNLLFKAIVEKGRWMLRSVFNQLFRMTCWEGLLQSIIACSR